MFPSSLKERPEDDQQLGLTLGSPYPYITAEKLGFLAAYGLELDEEDEEEDEESSSTKKSGNRFKANLLKRALSPPTIPTPLISPSVLGKGGKSNGIINKPRSGTTSTSWSPLSPNSKLAEKLTQSRHHSSSVSSPATTPASQARNRSKSNAAPLKDYFTQSSRRGPRRGYFDEDLSEDDASSLYAYSPSTILDDEDEDNGTAAAVTTTTTTITQKQQQHASTSTYTTTTEDSSNATHVDDLSLLAPPAILNAIFDYDNCLKERMIKSNSSMEDSDDSSSGKESGPFTPPSLPARPLMPVSVIAPSNGSDFHHRDMRGQINATFTTPNADIAPPLPSKDIIKPNALKAAQIKTIAADKGKAQQVSKPAPIEVIKETEKVVTAASTSAPISTPASTPAPASIPTPAPVSAPALVPTAAAKKARKEEAKKAAIEEKAVIAQEKVVKQKEEIKQKQDEIERKILLKSYDELEVERFLANFGKHVTNVRSNGLLVENSSSIRPKRKEWTSDDTGKLNVPGYFFAHLTNILGYIAHGDQHSIAENLQDTMPEEQFRIAALRANAERLYMTALPMYESTFSKLRIIWRWESKVTTMLWCSSYFALWYYGMLLCGIFGLSIWSVIRIRIFPPEPEAIRQMLREQHQRSRELQQAKKAKAEDVIRQAQEEEGEEEEEHKEERGEKASTTDKKKTKYRLAADATRKYGKVATMVTCALADVHERIKNFIMWKSIPATWRAILLLTIAMMASFLSTPWIMARLPGFTLGLCLFIVAPIAEHRPEWIGIEWQNPFDFILAGVPNDAQYAMQVLRTRAAAGEALTGDRDIADWMISGVDDEDDSIIAAMPGLEGVTGRTTAVSTAVNQATAAGSGSVIPKGRE